MGKKRTKKTPKTENMQGGGAEVNTQATAHENTEVQSNRIVICGLSGCFDMATIGQYCRLHYLSNWRKSKTKEAKKEGKELQDYLQELSTRFPEEFFEKLRNELEEMASTSESSDDREDRSSLYEQDDSDDMDTIIKGIRVEDF